MEDGHQGPGVFEAAMVDNFEEPKQPQASQQCDGRGAETDMIAYADTPSYAARFRMIILLSLICWGLVIAGAAVIAG